MQKVTDEFLRALIRGDKTPPKRIEEEHNIQVNCVKWFRLQYRNYASLLFAIPNGGLGARLRLGNLKPRVWWLVSPTLSCHPEGRVWCFVYRDEAEGRLPETRTEGVAGNLREGG